MTTIEMSVAPDGINSKLRRDIEDSENAGYLCYVSQGIKRGEYPGLGERERRDYVLLAENKATDLVAANV